MPPWMTLLLGAALLMALEEPGAAEPGRGLDASSILSNGQYRWVSDDDGRGDLSIIVSLTRQQLYVYRDDRLIGQSTVSTGTAGHATPVGEFTILQKNRWHRSNLYSNAPMPFMQRLTWDGIAIHAGDLPGYPASHGCIRLPGAFAARLFAMTGLGAGVTVRDRFGAPPVYLRVADLRWAMESDARVSSGVRMAFRMTSLLADTAVTGGSTRLR